MYRLLFLFCYLSVFSQKPPTSEVFLFDVKRDQDSLTICKGSKISTSIGYNNQPYFYDNNTLLYVSAPEGQTDIVQYNIEEKSTEFISRTPGSEFSPTRFPVGNDIASVRLEPDGTQQLYTYSNTGDSTQIKRLSELKIGYFDFYNKDEILAAVVKNGAMDLHFINIENQTDSLLIDNVGRSIKRIPETSNLSYSLVNNSEGLDIYMLDVDDAMSSYFICTLPIGIQDFTWLSSTQLLIGSRNQLFIYDTLGEAQWNPMATLEMDGLEQISRIAVSPDGTKIAIVAQDGKAE